MKNSYQEKETEYRPLVHFCPICGHSLHARESFVAEYWSAKQTVYFCWCHQCRWRGEITEVVEVTATELSE
ncbi:hypothetical protein BSNK01_29810 [Bacillaceae bacterium]